MSRGELIETAADAMILLLQCLNPLPSLDAVLDDFEDQVAAGTDDEWVNIQEDRITGAYIDLICKNT